MNRSALVTSRVLCTINLGANRPFSPIEGESTIKSRNPRLTTLLRPTCQVNLATISNSPHSLLNENVQCTYWAYVFSDPTGVLTIKIVQNPHILPPGHGFKKSLGSENAVLACSRLRESASADCLRGQPKNKG
jgi:hypothetical protein